MPYDPYSGLSGLLQSANYQLPRNQSQIPPNFYQQNQVPQGFNPPLPTPNPMRGPPPSPATGSIGAAQPPGFQAGSSGGWGAPTPGAMGMTVNDFLRGLGAFANVLTPGGYGAGPAAQAGAAAGPGLGIGRPPGGLPAGTYGGWNPQTIVPPAIAAATDQGRGLLSGTSFPNQPPSSAFAPGYGQPTGARGEPPTGQPQPVYPPGSPLNQNPPPAPQRKPQPKPRAKTQGNQATYTSKRKGTEWQPGRSGGYYEGLSGGFGSQPWRKPKR